MKNILSTFSLLAVLTSCAAANGPLPADASSRYFFFDGASFAEGRHEGVPSVMITDGYYPTVLPAKDSGRPRRLPDGNGGVVGFCFIQVSGGKLAPAGGGVPLGGRDVTITGEGQKVTVRTDEKGFFVTALPAGTYEIEFSGLRKVVDVKKGKSTVVALRGGKRMVD